MANQPRVIIAGAGPVGLYMAHALGRANIDYVVLEQSREIMGLRGAGILLFPNTVRLLDQLGLLERTEEVGTVFIDKVSLMSNGKVLSHIHPFQHLEEACAYPAIGLARKDVLDILYEGLPERDTRIRTSARIVDIETDDSGVRVRLEDGSVEEGSLVIGVDGVHSKTREIMNKLALASSKGKEEEYPMVASYIGLFGRAPCRDDYAEGRFYETHSSGVASQVMNGKDKILYGIYKALPQPTTERHRFTSQEIQEEAERLYDTRMFPEVKFKEIWETCNPATDATLAYVEEGFVERWHHGRIVLLGDAIHKQTPISGNGLNTGLQSAVVLANELQGLVASRPNFTSKELSEAFGRYEDTQKEATRAACDEGLVITRMVTWSSWLAWFYDRFVLPWSDLEQFMKDHFVTRMRDMHVLKFVPFQSKVGTVPWTKAPTA
ncbi:putative dehydrogenase [Hypoxylon sp. FL1284]|nr:putative dehydrogenase [Hypoxylon sp. FL1284]